MASNNDFDMYSDSDNESENNELTENNESSVNLNDSLTFNTEGLDDNDQLFKILSSTQKKTLKKCNFCFKNYSHDMIVDAESIDIMCWHCLFWLNYDINSRKDVDGNLGMTISDYIFKCQENHNMELCTKRTDQGGCFLCEYKLGYILPDIKDPWKIYDMNKICNDNKGDINIKDEYHELSDAEDESTMTVFI